MGMAMVLSSMVIPVTRPTASNPFTNILSLLRTPSVLQSLTFPCFGASSPTRMIDLLYALLATARSSLKPQRDLALQNLASRQQLAILKRKTKRPKLTNADRALWVALCGLWPDWQNALIII